MTLDELKDSIDEQYYSCEDPRKVEVKLALQPSYPMTGSIRNFCMEHSKDEIENTLWIACSDNEDYGCPRSAWCDYDIYEGEDDDE